MIKRIIFYIAVLFVTAQVVLNVYWNYHPKNLINDNKPVINYTIDEVMTLDKFNTYIQKQDDFVLAVFYDSSDINSAYMFNTAFENILKKHNISSFNGLIFVDMENEPMENMQMYKARYGFGNLPAIVKVKYERGTLTNGGAVFPETDQLIVTDQIEKFLIENGVITEIKDGE